MSNMVINRRAFDEWKERERKQLAQIKALEAERDALGEAVETYRGLAEGAPVGASDGQTFAARFVTPKEFEDAIIARAAELKGENT